MKLPNDDDSDLLVNVHIEDGISCESLKEMCRFQQLIIITDIVLRLLPRVHMRETEFCLLFIVQGNFNY